MIGRSEQVATKISSPRFLWLAVSVVRTPRLRIQFNHLMNDSGLGETLSVPQSAGSMVRDQPPTLLLPVPPSIRHCDECFWDTRLLDHCRDWSNSPLALRLRGVGAQRRRRRTPHAELVDRTSMRLAVKSWISRRSPAGRPSRCAATACGPRDRQGTRQTTPGRPDHRRWAVPLEACTMVTPIRG